MTILRLLLLLAVAPLLFCQCTNLRSESGLYDVTLLRNVKVNMDGYWFANDLHRYNDIKKGSIYIAPLDISRVSADEPEYAPILQEKMDSAMKESIGKALQTNSNGWTLAPAPDKATIRIDIAVVKFKPQRPALRLLGNIGSLFSPVPGTGNAVDAISGGDIGIEGAIHDVKTGDLLMAFKDHNRKSGHYVSGTAFTRLGPAEASLESWAKTLGLFMVARNVAAKKGKTPQQLLDEETMLHAMERRLKY